MPLGDSRPAVARTAAATCTSPSTRATPARFIDATTPGSLVVYNTRRRARDARRRLAIRTPPGRGARDGRYNFGTLGRPPTPMTPGTVANVGRRRTCPTPSPPPNGSKVYVTSQLDGAVYAIDTASPARTLTQTLATSTPRRRRSCSGRTPSRLLLSAAQSTLYVANADADDISIVDTATDRSPHHLAPPPWPAGAATLPGVTPTDLGLSPDGHAVRDPGRHERRGSGQPARREGRRATSPSAGTRPPSWQARTGACSSPTPRASQRATRTLPIHYPAHWQRRPATRSGTGGRRQRRQTLSLPTAAPASAGHPQVLGNNGITDHAPPRRTRWRASACRSGIKHVIYIVKENRTYDQVLGDVPAGNGEPSLALFGQSVTPNEHALAERFVLLDNFYDCAEVSGDGWPWSTQGQANEEVIKNVPQNYSGRGPQLRLRGHVQQLPGRRLPGDRPATARPSSAPTSPFSGLTSPRPSRTSPRRPGGHIWDDVTRTASPSATTAISLVGVGTRPTTPPA